MVIMLLFLNKRYRSQKAKKINQKRPDPPFWPPWPPAVDVAAEKAERAEALAASAAACLTVSFFMTPDVNSAWALAIEAPVLRYIR